jgi:hypothetical protein
LLASASASRKEFSALTAPTRIDARQEPPKKDHELTEIDRASLALRTVQPDLEEWPADGADPGPGNRPRRIWPVVLAMWIGGVVILAAVAAAVISLIVG